MASVLLPESGVWFQVKITTKDKALSGRVLECRVKTLSWFDMDVTLTNMEGEMKHCLWLSLIDFKG